MGCEISLDIRIYLYINIQTPVSCWDGDGDVRTSHNHLAIINCNRLGKENCNSKSKICWLKKTNEPMRLPSYFMCIPCYVSIIIRDNPTGCCTNCIPVIARDFLHEWGTRLRARRNFIWSDTRKKCSHVFTMLFFVLFRFHHQPMIRSSLPIINSVILVTIVDFSHPTIQIDV